MDTIHNQPVLYMANSPGVEDTHEEEEKPHNALGVPPLHRMVLPSRGSAVHTDDAQETGVALPVCEETFMKPTRSSNDLPTLTGHGCVTSPNSTQMSLLPGSLVMADQVRYMV